MNNPDATILKRKHMYIQYVCKLVYQSTMGKKWSEKLYGKVHWFEHTFICTEFIQQTKDHSPSISIYQDMKPL